MQQGIEHDQVRQKYARTEKIPGGRSNRQQMVLLSTTRNKVVILRTHLWNDIENLSPDLIFIVYTNPKCIVFDLRNPMKGLVFSSFVRKRTIFPVVADV